LQSQSKVNTMDGNGQPPYPPSPQSCGGGDNNVENNDIDRPLHSPQNNADRLEEDQHNYLHKRNNDGKHSEHNSSRRGRKERRRRKRNRHHYNNDIPLNYELHHQMQRNHPERYALYVNLMNQQERQYNNDREMRDYDMDREHKSEGSRRRRRDDRQVNDELSNMGRTNHKRSHSWSPPRKQHNHQSSSRRNYRRKRSRSRSCSNDLERFGERRSNRHSSRRAMKRYSRSYSIDRSSSSISTRRRDRRRDDSSRRRDRGRHRYRDSSNSSSREQSRRRDRRRRRRRDEGHHRNRRNNNIEEGGQNDNNREEGNEGIRIVVSEDSDNHLGAAGGKADTTAVVAVNQMERPSRRDSEEADLGEDRSVESNRKKSASNKKSRHRNRSRQSSRSDYSRSTSRSLSPQGNETNYRRGDSSFKQRSYSHSPQFHSKVERSKKKKKKRGRRRRDRSSSFSLSRSRSRDRRRSNYSRSSSPGSRHRPLSPRMYSGHGHYQREHFSRSRSFSSSRSDYKKQNKRRHKKNKKKDKKKKHENHHSGSSRDDTVGHFRGGPGTVIDNRYRIIRDVGLGTFGRVVQCENLRPNHRQCSSSWYDHQQDNLNATVAIKVVRNIQRYHESAIIEADICERINMEQSRQKKDLCATLLDRFSLSSGHYCLAFECLGKSLYDFLKMHKYRPFPMFCVRDFAQQLLETLEFLHGFGLIHTDLKVRGVLQLCL